MTVTGNIVAPPYHVQSTAEALRDGFPYFDWHESVSPLWARKWRTLCAGGIYPFTDGDVADFDPIFAELVALSSDDPATLHRPDDYARGCARQHGRCVPDRWGARPPKPRHSCRYLG